MHQKAKAMCIVGLIDPYYHEAWLSADKTPVPDLLDLSLKLLIATVTTACVLEVVTELMGA